jgi:hypothetical protein
VAAGLERRAALAAVRLSDLAERLWCLLEESRRARWGTAGVVAVIVVVTLLVDGLDGFSSHTRSGCDVEVARRSTFHEALCA